VEAGLICIFIEPHILNEARVSSYITVTRYFQTFLQGKKLKYEFQGIKMIVMGDFKGIVHFFLEIGSFYNSPMVKQLGFIVFECIQPIF